jgi:magnesium chelatase subunit ChlD-like protein
MERKARAMVAARTGRARGGAPVAPGDKAFDLALDATLKQAALRRASELEVPSSKFQVQSSERAITRADLCRKRRYRPCENLLTLLVDSSDSMGQGTEARMKACKGAVLAVLRRGYQNRSRVALIGFGGEHARVVLPPTRSISRARHLLERLPTGGATPFADGLFKAWQLIRQEKLKNSGVRPVLLIVSDGEANVPRTAGKPAVAELYALAHAVAKDRLATVLIDVVGEHKHSLEMRRLARCLRASYVAVTDLKPKHILEALKMCPFNSSSSGVWPAPPPAWRPPD